MGHNAIIFEKTNGAALTSIRHLSPQCCYVDRYVFSLPVLMLQLGDALLPAGCNHAKAPFPLAACSPTGHRGNGSVFRRYRVKGWAQA